MVLSRAVLVSAKSVVNFSISDLLLFISDLLLSTDVLRSVMVSINPGFWSSPSIRFFTTSLTFLISSLLLVFWASSFWSRSAFAAVIFSSTAVFALAISVFTSSLL